MMPSILPDKTGEEKPPLLGTVILSGYAATVGLYLAVLTLPGLLRPAPWVFVLSILVFSLFSALYRIGTWNLRLPMLWHGFVAAIALWLGIAGWVFFRGGPVAACFSRPFGVVAEEWEWLLVVVLTWVLTVWFGDLLRRLARVPQHPAVPKPSKQIWEDADNRISLVPWEDAWKSWRGSLCGVIILEVLGWIVVRGVSPQSIRPSAGWLLLLETGIGLGLWSLGYFYYQRAFWRSDKLVPGSGLSRNWLRFCAGFIVILVCAALVLPATVPSLNWDFLGRLLAKLEISGDATVPESILSRNPGRVQETMPPRDFSIISLIMGLLYQVILPLFCLLFIIGVIGYLFFRFCAGEVDKIKGLRGALIKFYLFWRGLFTRCLRSVTEYLGMKPLSQDSVSTEARSRKKHSSLEWGRGPRAIIRRGYYRLIQFARESGLKWRHSRTPEELAADLARILPQDGETISTLTEDYLAARYGPEPPAAGRAGRFERLRRVVLNHLKGKGKSNDSGDENR
ncbi:MAG TPA: DUF4129 domain-containing protein [Bacillota bacterium]